MEKMPSSEKLQIQKDSLQRAIDFIKFAEAKNGAAIAFASGMILAQLRLRATIPELDIVQLSGLILALLGALVSTKSFIPKLSFTSDAAAGVDTKGNLLFYGEIAKLSEEEFRSKFDSRYSDEGKLLEDYANQVIANSKIASEKMGHFSIAVLLIGGGGIMLLLDLAFQFFSKF
ncbi:Pycsar system effector family protein [Roseovarius indicus]|uniref:Pycsar system effector family protein n=1 Tax=Roseovarius indicus TaxID=540747 RepID=UPI0007D9CA91|nr:Pycsar system effector family protein [Roseovarius indicus]OAO05369.1 hypothetical protein A8B76_02700 [Roseovarius indicus]